MQSQPNESDDFRAAESCGTQVQATLTFSDGQSHPAGVLELSQGVIVLEIRGEPPPAVAIGEKARVTLVGECLGHPLSVSTCVTSRSTRSDALVLRLVAEDPRTLQGTPSVRRRQALRVTPRHDAASVAELRPESGGEPVVARVLDLSRSGLRVELGLLDEGEIANCKCVHVRLQIANEPEELQFVAEIRSRTLQGENIQCGLQILLERTDAGAEVDRRLGRYVMSRQVESVLDRKRPKAS